MRNINKKTITMDLETKLLLVIDRKRLSGITQVTRTQWIKDQIMKALTVEDFQVVEKDIALKAVKE